ncbi:MAG: proline--tRNA ligase [Chlamydiae bacterium]|nr:proline--tRNA ligase [Chlamydiota bacterium]MBI3265767.1 proline--tRNA ligase [Chlamydiota bacterium]
MRWTKTFIPTLKESPLEAEIRSHRLMLRSGLIQKLSSGLYSFLPLGLRSLRKIEKIIREEMDSHGAIELLLPILQPKEIWTQSGRWDSMRDLMLVAEDRMKRSFVLGPTHEEIITDLAAKRIRSYRDLPKNFYQIQTKFRDEIRPRFGLMRAREFLMKDSYSFDTTDEAAQKAYWNMVDAYRAIFKRCGFKFKMVEADTGVMGGSLSHEFMVLADSGEDEILVCSKCDDAFNREWAVSRGANASSKSSEPSQKGGVCPKCATPYEILRGIEVGHVFKLGTKYSAILGAHYLNEQGVQNPCVMGCYGIGVSRCLAAFIEQNSNEQGILWNRALAPYEILILPVMMENLTVKESAENLYHQLKEQNFDCLLDDRGERAGVKFKDADLIGFPLQVTLGQKLMDTGQVEIRSRFHSKTELVNLQDAIGVIGRVLEEMAPL